MASAVQRRVEKARALIGLVLSVASKAVEEAREGKEPLVAFAGQLACCGGCADTDCYCMGQTKSAVGGIVCILLEIEIQLIHAVQFQF